MTTDPDFTPAPVPKNLTGLQRICRNAGGLQVENILWQWDYYTETPYKAGELSKQDQELSNRARRIKRAEK